MLPENPVMIGVGVLLMLVSRFGTSASAPFGGKPIRPMTDTERLILFGFGYLSFLLGLFRLLHK